MATRMWGEYYLTADLASATVAPSVIQPVFFDTDVLIYGMAAAFAFYNDPAFTALGMSLFSSSGTGYGIPAQRVAYTNSYAKALLLTSTNGFKSVGFTLTQVYKVRANTIIQACPFVTGYTGTSSSHIAWQKAYPDPWRTDINEVEITIDNTKLATLPFHLSFFGKKL
jgi:hypothetical protein